MLGTSALSISPMISSCSPAEKKEEPPVEEPIKGNIRHSACRWCYSDIPLEKMAEEGKKLGLVGIDLLKPEEWALKGKYLCSS